MGAFTLHSPANYGAIELKRSYEVFLVRGFIIASLLHLLAICGYWSSRNSDTGQKVTPPRHDVVTSSVQPPPIIVGPEIINRRVLRGGVSKAELAIPVPVPGFELREQPDFPSQGEVGKNDGIVDGTVGEGMFSHEGPEGATWEEKPPEEYVPYEIRPEPIKQLTPKYPDLATRAGLEGTVWVKIWVDKEGKARKALVMKSDAEIFNQPAIDAAMQWVFTPAMMKNGPVSVWVSIPFRFKLQGK